MVHRKTKILCLSVSAGAGHLQAAEALCAYGNQKEEIETLHLDVMNYVPKTFRAIYVDSYLKLVQKFPTAWGFVYKATDKAKADELLQKLRRIVERLNTRALAKAVEEFAPDIIICTHFLPAEILMHQIDKQRLTIPVWVQVTDFDLHHMWVIPNMTGYFVANEEVAFRLTRAGVMKERIHVTGIPIKPAFSEVQDRIACTNSFGLRADIPTLLLMGGGAGLGALDDVVEYLLTQNNQYQLIVLAGKNEKLLQSLQKIAEAHPTQLFPMGFTDSVEKIMACANLVISKPGGLTSSECLAMGLPMIVHAPIPGQEEHNADYLLEQGVAFKAIDETGLVFRVNLLMNSPEKLMGMSEKARKLGRPFAARSVLDIVLAHNQNCPTTKID